MNKYQDNWINNPTPNQVFWATVLWAISTTLLLLSITDLFTANPFQARYAPIFLLILGASVMIFRVHQNYRKE